MNVRIVGFQIRVASVMKAFATNTGLLRESSELVLVENFTDWMCVSTVVSGLTPQKTVW
jgi:hypothetical protein